MARSARTMATTFIYGFLMTLNRVPLTGVLCVMAESRVENYPQEKVLLAYRKFDSIWWLPRINLCNYSSCPVCMMVSGVSRGDIWSEGQQGVFGLGDGTLSLSRCSLHQPWGDLWAVGQKRDHWRPWFVDRGPAFPSGACFFIGFLHVVSGGGHLRKKG